MSLGRVSEVVGRRNARRNEHHRLGLVFIQADAVVFYSRLHLRLPESREYTLAERIDILGIWYRFAAQRCMHLSHLDLMVRCALWLRSEVGGILIAGYELYRSLVSTPAWLYECECNVYVIGRRTRIVSRHWEASVVCFLN